MTKKEIEDYINTYRLYPAEYTGIRDNSLITKINASYRFDPNDKTITRLEGKINDHGDFEIVGLFKFPLGRPEEKIPASWVDMDYIIKAYNQLLTSIGVEDKTILQGTDRENWNLRDMVSEVEYLRSTYYDKNHPRSQLRETDPIHFKRHTYRLRTFLRKHRDDIDGLEVTVKHNSKYD